MTDFLLNLALVAALLFLGFNLHMLVDVLREKHVPTARNEVEEEEGANEKEPRHQI